MVKAAYLVHLPSGVKLFYVLIFGWVGVVALFISNLYLSMLGILKGGGFKVEVQHWVEKS
ncbi:MAG: hypothetical protein EBS66_17865 [Betaproteobacteria bacterium]|nr:hypothetical protein [Betaproteobacteria bacterium]